MVWIKGGVGRDLFKGVGFKGYDVWVDSDFLSSQILSLLILKKRDIIAFNPHPFKQFPSLPTLNQLKIWVNSDIMAFNPHPLKQVSSYPTLNQ